MCVKVWGCVRVGFVMCGCVCVCVCVCVWAVCNVWVCLYVGFVMFCVCMCGFGNVWVRVCVCMYGFCVCVCVCVDFVICGYVYFFKFIYYPACPITQ